MFYASPKPPACRRPQAALADQMKSPGICRTHIRSSSLRRTMHYARTACLTGELPVKSADVKTRAEMCCPEQYFQAHSADLTAGPLVPRPAYQIIIEQSDLIPSLRAHRL